jgi:hypothetical protein
MDTTTLQITVQTIIRGHEYGGPNMSYPKLAQNIIDLVRHEAAQEIREEGEDVYNEGLDDSYNRSTGMFDAADLIDPDKE